MKADQRIQNQQRGPQCGQRLLQSAPVALQIQAQAGPEQMVSARLLPSVAVAEVEATPVTDVIEEAEEAASAA